jgi:hypothetical protein
MKRLIFVMFFPAALFSQNDNGIVGTWQLSYVLGSGWADTYLFFEDGTYRFFFNQMDCDKREVSHSGKWSLKENDLELSVLETVILEGGEMVVSTGSCGSDSTLVNAVEKKLIFDPPQKRILKKAKVHVISIDGVERTSLSLDGKKHWYYGDPKEMIRQFEN